jgi:hypothetical protein
MSKYLKPLRKLQHSIDVYDVIDAFDVTNPAIAHAIKKLLAAGKRGSKGWEQDLEEALESIHKAFNYKPEQKEVYKGDDSFISYSIPDQLHLHFPEGIPTTERNPF